MSRKSKRSPTFAAIAARAKLSAEPSDAWHVGYFQRHPDDDPDQVSPGRDYLNGCPKSVRAHFRSVIIAVAKAPPTKFAGGGAWEAMHGDMTGYFEIRKKYESNLYRLFCLLDSKNPKGDTLVILGGLTKADHTKFTESQYAGIRALGEEYLARIPRSLYAGASS